MSPVRSVRSGLEVAFPVLGSALILSAVLFVPDGPVQLLVAVLGILLLLVNSLELNQPLLPNERRFLALRMEVDDFMDAVRRVNAAAIAARQGESAEARRDFERGCQELVARAEHIGAMAGRTHGALGGVTGVAVPAGGPGGEPGA